MSTVTDRPALVREPALSGQTVVLIGGGSGIGLATARLAHAEGEDDVLAGRDPERFRRAADVGARSHAAFDATDDDRLDARVNVIATGFVDTPLSASLLGNALHARREQLRATLPIRRVVGPEDVAALAVHVRANTALTGATFDVDGGQQITGNPRNR